MSARRTQLGLDRLEDRLALAVYYVSTQGNDQSDGSQENPFQTLQRAADAVAAGDAVYVSAGNYAGFDLWTDGTADAPISFVADHGVVINAANRRTADGINLEGADYILIDGFTVQGVGRAGIRSVENRFVTITNNVCDGNGRWGIFTGFSDDVVIENNIASNSVLEHGIYVSNSGDRPMIRNNRVFGNAGCGIHMNGDLSQGGDGIISRALVEGNSVYGNGRSGGSGINADGVQRSIFRNNLLYDNHASGFSFFQQDGAAGSSNNVVVNNTVIQAADGRWALNIRDASTNNYVANNIFLSNHSYRGAISISTDSLAGFVSDYNAAIDRFTLDDGDTVIGLAAWRAATGQDSHSFVADAGALFVHATANDYRLRADSPAVDRGTSNQAPGFDLSGNVRPTGAAVDVGAYEYVAASENRAPVALDDDASFDEDAVALLMVLQNDMDPDGDPIVVSILTNPLHGSITVNVDGSILYRPAANYNGTDSFQYRATDASGAYSDATVTLTIRPVNDDPTARDDQASVRGGDAVAVAVLANDSDVDGDLLKIQSYTQGRNGAVSLGADGRLVYTARTGYVGADQFQYTVSDGAGGTATANVVVNVQGEKATASLQADPWFADRTSLVVIGTSRNDRISFETIQGGSKVRAWANGKALGTFQTASFSRIVAYGMDGNDVIEAPASCRISVYFDGGAGADVLRGGRGNDVLVGGAGRDTLMGRQGSDVLIGGDGADVINARPDESGKRGDDLVFAGGLGFLADPSAMARLQGEWTSGRPLADRISRLTSGADGLPVVNADASLADHAVDVVYANREGDWLFGESDLDVFVAPKRRK